MCPVRSSRSDNGNLGPEAWRRQMQINGTYSVHGAHQIKPAAKQTLTETQNTQNIFQPQDEVEFSSEANWISKVNDLPDVRADRVAELRAQIQTGTYDTEAKLELALDRLLDEIG
jgi:negative regulator of flagellin synthesis FlgM